MKRVYLLVIVGALGCSSISIPGSWHRDEPEISDVVAQYGGEEYILGVRALAPPEVLKAYTDAITAHADELLDERRADPLLEVVKVDIVGLTQGDPTMVRAEILGKVDSTYEKWSLKYGGRHVALFKADYLFTPDNQFISIRDSALVDVYNEI